MVVVNTSVLHLTQKEVHLTFRNKLGSAHTQVFYIITESVWTKLIRCCP